MLPLYFLPHYIWFSLCIIRKQMRKMKNIRNLPLHPPHTQPPLPLHLCLPAIVNHPAYRTPFVLVVERVDILQWRSRPLLQGKGNLSPNAASVGMNPRGRGSGGRLLASHVTSVASVRLPVGNHPQTAWIGLASGFLFLFFTCRLHSIFLFRNLIGPFLVNVKPVECSANTQPNPVVGHPVDLLAMFLFHA